jgi:hypothetical protein
MDRELAWIAKATGARSVERADRIQSLWSGYGEIFRVELTDAAVASAIVKWVKPPARRERGDASSHARKCRSYDVESVWYREFAARCGDACRVAKLLHFERKNAEWRFLLEDLDAAGYPGRRDVLSVQEIELCLTWLARFHARFIGVEPEGLWRTGTYWHLATRREELQRIEDRELCDVAAALDGRLSSARFKTIVHGDAKVHNFCFSSRGHEVAAVDFQYVGGGCGMKDVAYLLSDHPAPHSEADEARYLDFYCTELRAAVAANGAAIDAAALEREWRELYPIAHADFYRFLAGWAPEHWQRDTHAQRRVSRVIARLGR